MGQAAQLLAWTAMGAMLMSACGKKAAVVSSPMPTAPVVEAPPAPPPPPEVGTLSTPESAALGEEEIFARKTLDELNAEQPLADAFFDVDQATIREDSRLTLQRNAEWLRRFSGSDGTRSSEALAIAMTEQRRAGPPDSTPSLVGIVPTA
jgi:hypothetical protein